MFLKPDYNLKNIYEINLEELKQRGIKNILFDLDSTIMQSKTASYTEKTLEWLKKVRKDFFIAVLSNNHNEEYIAKVKPITDFPMVFCAANSVHLKMLPLLWKKLPKPSCRWLYFTSSQHNSCMRLVHPISVYCLRYPAQNF